MKQFVAYKGPFFTIEWFYGEGSKSQPLEYFYSLNAERQHQVLKLFRLMGDRGIIHNITKFRNEGDGIYAFKPQPDRFLCFFCAGKRIVITNAFEKKQNNLPLREKEKAVIAKKNYEELVRKGIYYE